jgi:hypothetical protein
MRTPGRIGVVLTAVLGAIVFASTAATANPVKTSFSNVTFSSTLSGVCSFDVNVASVVSGFEIDFFDQAGTQVKAQIHQVEQDTFTANGKTLTGLPFTFNLDIPLDSDGNPTAVVATGVAEKIPLPDGTLFVSAGYVDFLDHPGVSFILSPDRGNPGNVAAFCAALAP